jgi:hypothetical protein
MREKPTRLPAALVDTVISTDGAEHAVNLVSSVPTVPSLLLLGCSIAITSSFIHTPVRCHSQYSPSTLSFSSLSLLPSACHSAEWADIVPRNPFHQPSSLRLQHVSNVLAKYLPRQLQDHYYRLQHSLQTEGILLRQHLAAATSDLSPAWHGK